MCFGEKPRYYFKGWLKWGVKKKMSQARKPIPGKHKIGYLGFLVAAVEATANLRGPRIEIWASVEAKPTFVGGPEGDLVKQGLSGFKGLFWGGLGFWAAISDAGILRPRHNYMQVLTIDEMLGFGHGGLISLPPDFLISGFSI